MTTTTTERRAVGLTLCLLGALLAGATAGATAQQSVSFTQDTYTEARGDVFTVTLDMGDRETAYLDIGSRDAGYRVYAEVTDADGDGQATVTVNSYYALEDRTNGGVGVAGDDEVRVLQRVFPSQPRAAALSGSYPLAVGTGYSPTRGVTDIVDEATMRTTARETRGISIWSGPGQEISFDTREEFLALLNGTSLTEFVGPTDRVAKEDYAVVELRATGLFGAVETRNDLTGVGNRGPTGLSMTVQSVPEGANTEVRRVDLTDRDNVLVTDPANDTMYLVLTTATETFQPRTFYRAEFVLNETNRLVEDTSPGLESERATQEFLLAERSLSLTDVSDGDRIQVSGSGTLSLSGTTTLARGTTIDMTLTATDDGPPLQATDSVTVARDMTFEAALPVSNLTRTREVRLEASDDYGTLATVDLRLAPGEPVTTTTTTTTETPQERPTTTETPTTTTTTEPAMPTETTTMATTTTEGTPGFTVVAALAAALAAAMLALRRR